MVVALLLVLYMCIYNAFVTLMTLHYYIFRYEFKTNHEEWINTVKPRLGSDVSDPIHAAITSNHENIKAYYKVRTEMRAALRNLLKVLYITGRKRN